MSPASGASGGSDAGSAAVSSGGGWAAGASATAGTADGALSTAGVWVDGSCKKYQPTVKATRAASSVTPTTGTTRFMVPLLSVLPRGAPARYLDTDSTVTVLFVFEFMVIAPPPGAGMAAMVIFMLPSS